MKKGGLVVLFMGVWVLGFGQVTFQKAFGGTSYDGGYSVQQTTDSGFIIAGYTQSLGAGSSDVYLIKTDTNGDTIWTKTLGGTSSDGANSIYQTSDGGYIIAGWTYSFGAGISDAYLIRTDSIGDTLWTKTLGGASNEDARSVQQTNDGGYIIAGKTESFGAGISDVYLIKTDNYGDTLWTKTYGSTDGDGANSVQQTTDGGYIIAGWYDGSGSLGSANLIKTDSSGNVLWSKIYSIGTVAYSVQQTIDGGYIVTGESCGFGCKTSVSFLLKTDSNGDTLWAEIFVGTGSTFGRGTSVQQTTDYGYIIVALGGAVNLIKTDNSGNLIWSKSFDGGVPCTSVMQTTDGGYIIAGDGVYLIKTDDNGNSGCNEINPPNNIFTSASQVSSPVTIVTSPPTVVTIPATVTGSGGTVTTLCISTGIGEIVDEESSFSLSPNPATNQFTITSAFAIKEITICNVLGESVYTERLNTKYKTLNTNLPAGIYFVRVAAEDFVAVKKLVIN